jgi:hypothetical protein
MMFGAKSEKVAREGDHESMFHEPNVRVFSQRLRQALQLGEQSPLRRFGDCNAPY